MLFYAVNAFLSLTKMVELGIGVEVGILDPLRACSLVLTEACWELGEQQ